MKHVRNKYMSRLTSPHWGKRALYSQDPGFTLIGLTWETCLFFNQSLWPREWNMVIGQIWEMRSSWTWRDRGGDLLYRLTLDKEWENSGPRRKICCSQKQEMGRTRRQKTCEYVGSGGKGVNPEVKVQSRKGYLWSWHFKLIWSFEWLVGIREEVIYSQISKNMTCPEKLCVFPVMSISCLP